MTDESRSRGEEARPRGDVRYLLGAAALVVVVAALALVFGIVRPPAVAALTDAQRSALPGGVAWTEFNDRDGCTDLMVATPSAGPESVACDANLYRVVGWTESGISVVSSSESGSTVEERDPSSGGVVSTTNVPGYDPRWDAVDDAGFAADRVDGKLMVSNRDGTVVWETPADAHYEIRTIVISPDGQWLAMTDSAERLLVVRADGSEPPAVWATGVREWSWRSVVWEGTEPPE